MGTGLGRAASKTIENHRFFVLCTKHALRATTVNHGGFAVISITAQGGRPDKT
jgi:hypothetical protein